MRRHIASWPAAALFLAAALSTGAVAAGPAVAETQAAPSAQALQPLTIVSKNGRHDFSVEVATTEPERERGLMYRRFMPADRGMLFDFAKPQTITMWMKNTYIPLDMVFMNRAGDVTSIAADAEPLSERIISSGGPAFAVLEINGGLAAKLGIAVGDKVDAKMFRAHSQ